MFVPSVLHICLKTSVFNVLHVFNDSIALIYVFSKNFDSLLQK